MERRQTTVDPGSSHDSSNAGVVPGKQPLIGASIARAATGDPRIAPDADVHVDAAARGSGAALPGGLAGSLSSALGADVSGVRIHTGAESQRAAAALAANAYTIGSDVHFGAGKYRPGDADGERLIAHEVAHTVQQRGAAPSGSFELSTPGDASEVEAESFADAFASGAPAAVTPRAGAVARQVIARDPSGPNAHVGGERGEINMMDNAETGRVVGPGEAGYSDQVLRRTGGAAGDLAAGGLYQGARLRNIVPNTSIIDSQSRTRAAEKARMLSLANSGWFGPDGITPQSHFAAGLYNEAATWAQEHLNTLANHKNDEITQFGAYNGYVSFANSFFESLLRLEAMQNMLNVSNPAQMAASLIAGLEDARSVAGRAREAFTAGATGSTRALNVPAPDTSVSVLLGQVNLAQQEMGTAHMHFQLNRLETERMNVNNEGIAARARQTEIEGIKTFLRQVGSTIDTTASVISGAPAVMNRATDVLRAGEAHINSARNRREILAGGRGSHNPTYMTSNEDGDLVVRNTMTGMDTPAAGGAATAAPAAGLPSLPTSVSDLLGTIADFAYSAELRRLTETLNAIAGRCEAIAGVEHLVTLAHRARTYMDKVLAFSRKCAELHVRMVARRQAYLDLGVELDNYARGDRESRRRGEAPGAGEERYATIMMATSAVREVLAVGRTSLDNMPMTPEAMQAWFRHMHGERTASPPRTDMHTFEMGQNETEKITDVFDSLELQRTNVRTVQTVFAGVEATANTVMTAVSPASAGAGAPGGAAEGRTGAGGAVGDY